MENNGRIAPKNVNCHFHLVTKDKDRLHWKGKSACETQLDEHCREADMSDSAATSADLKSTFQSRLDKELESLLRKIVHLLVDAENSHKNLLGRVECLESQKASEVIPRA